MDKDNRYWNKHKQIYNELLNELDNSIINRIYSNPNCAEAQLLNKRVDKRIIELYKEESTA
jgi:succinate dehydrogenase flavin-adding protein (antitoxin of CptAB toxin-antitoxin module)